MKQMAPLLLLLLLAMLPVHAQPASAWTEVTPEGKAFSILFPGMAVKQTQKIKTASGMLDVTSYALNPEKNRPAYLLSYSEFAGHADKLTAQQRLDKASAGAVASTKGKVQSEKKLTLQNNPGRELLILTQEGQHLNTRFYIVGERLYQLFVVGTPDQVAGKSTGKFFDSFKLKE